MAIQQKLIDFNNPVFKSLLSYNFKVEEKHLKHFIMPQTGDTITLGNIIYRITYVRENPFRFSCEPVGIIEDDEFVKRLTEKPEPKTQDVDTQSPTDVG